MNDPSQMKGLSDLLQSIAQRAQDAPDMIAMRCPGKDGRYDVVLTNRDMETRTRDIAAGLLKHGVKTGMHVVVMVRPTPEFFLLMYALFRMGGVPVLVDPGIDKRALRQCLNEADVDVFIGIPLAHIARVVLRWAPKARIRITTGKRPWLADLTLAQIEASGKDQPLDVDVSDREATTAILFTSGSTGVPKGVVYRRRHFGAQITMLGESFGITAGGVDFPTFPPFALFDPALGLTSVIPDMDPTRPAQADPRKLHAAIDAYQATQLFGSPALMRVLADYGKPLPTLQRVTSAGAPVPPEVVSKMLALLPEDAHFWTPYGATECLPVSVIDGRELITLRERTEQGAGTCVGRPVPPNEIRIIKIDDQAIPEWSDELLVQGGQVGEITVAGPTATDSYYNRDQQTRLSKITEQLADGSTRVIHRMGDLGYVDALGRLWFCGRKTQRVVTSSKTLCTEQVEPIFNTHPDVKRTALVGVGTPGKQIPVLCVELNHGVPDDQKPRIEEELFHLSEGFVHTAAIELILFHEKFPVDIRHNAKIGRERLAAWAAKQIKQHALQTKTERKE